MRDAILDIVQRYVNPKVRKAGPGNISTTCPFHSVKDGTPFSVNIELGLFNCFTCHASGTIPTMLHMLGIPEATIEAELGPLREAIRNNIANRQEARKAKYFTGNPFRAPFILSEAIIAGFNWCPTGLVQSGFDPRWLQYLQVGVDQRNQRVTYPVRDIYGNLAGFVGGATNIMQVPKYKVYEGRRAAIDGSIIPSDYGPWFDEDYPGYEFLKSNYLWNYDKVYPRLFFGKEAELLVIVEGFKACIWSLQCGFRNSVALMGSSMSERQKELILRVDTRVVLFLDNNSAGRIGTLKIGTELQKAMPTVWVALYPQGAGEGCQPDDLEPELVQEAIRSAAPFRFWRRERNFV
jgi:DNA primase